MYANAKEIALSIVVNVTENKTRRSEWSSPRLSDEQHRLSKAHRLRRQHRHAPHARRPEDVSEAGRRWRRRQHAQ